MTAEVCLMNQMGVALASDSAVTLVGSAMPKIYNSADKLFLLSERSPVGIMIYGGAGLQHIPWETLVKEYRSQTVSAKPRPTVEAYGRDFLAFLHRRIRYFPTATQEEAVHAHVAVTFREIARLVKKRVESEMNQRGSIPKDEMRAQLPRWAMDAVDLFHQGILKFPRLRPLLSSKVLRQKYSAVIRKKLSEDFSNFPTTRSFLAKATSVVIEALRRRTFTDNASGVVIAGFGKDEILPAMVQLQAQDVVADRVRYAWVDGEKISNQNPACVISFAQKEMVHLFMEGIDPALERLLMALVERVYRSLPAEFAKVAALTATAKLNEQMEALAGSVLPKMWNEIRRYRQQHFSQPVMEIVTHLPKAELAAMAEALVNLTSFRRRVSREAATVGGPIDVAVITKGDGFVWIRRKHYFDPALNPRYIARHYQ